MKPIYQNHFKFDMNEFLFIIKKRLLENATLGNVLDIQNQHKFCIMIATNIVIRENQSRHFGYEW